MDNKICVYAISKNEAHFVDRWYESMKEADAICVLDTGSTDDTVEKLKSHGVIVEQKIISPWRFDVARNESMKLIPEDCNILACVDIDEVFEPGWAEKLKKAWTPNTTRANYVYTWSHTESGADLRSFVTNKIHDRTWSWRFPVHESLYKENENEGEHIFIEGLRIHHYPAYKESRGSYLPLLELRVEEYPEDWMGKLYLGHEYNFRGQYEDSIKQLMDILMNYSEHYSAIERSSCYLFIGDDYKALGDNVKAMQSYLLAIEQEPTLREPYLAMAQTYLDMKLNTLAIEYTKEAIRKGVRHYSWLERDSSWSYQPWDILTQASFYLGKKRDSIAYAYRALQFDSNDERLQNNLKSCLEMSSNEDLIKD